MRITDVTMATLVLGRVTDTGDGHWQLTWTNAGHPHLCSSPAMVWRTT